MFIVKHKKFFIGLSVFLVAVSVFLLSFFFFKFGIDFKGGAMTEFSYVGERPSVEQLSEKFSALNIGQVLIQPEGENEYSVKTRHLSKPERQALVEAATVGEMKATEKSFTSIGPSVGRELTRKAITLVILVSLGIVFFIAYAFRRVSKPVSSWRYGLIAIVTLLHDVFIPIGLFTLLSHYKGVEVDTLFVVAILTVLGLSVSDTIVVFDRIRENLKNHTANTFAETVGRSIKETFTRSINTSLTVIIALLSLFFFGPESTKYFALMLTAGMFFGTYSSIFLASPLLVVVQEWQDSRALKAKSNK